ncbi:MAG: class I SAM-dependent methyltransferase [Rhodobacteraceae bacterium]|nr:class I SAM-dependent methyltransferase [Paracoccaceae bacterium]
MCAKDNTNRHSHGYVTEVPYTWSYFHYQSPVLLSYVAWLNGLPAPDPRGAFTHVDLGCGNGVTSNLLAAAYPQAQFYGIDFNADHIRNAQRIAQQADLKNVTFIDASFDEMSQHDLPKFDYITLHGVYSWVSADVRAQVDTVINTMLKPGGLVYLCYNTLPGAAALMPVWKMMQVYAHEVEGDVQTRAQSAIDTIRQMHDTKARFFTENPTVDKYFVKMLKRDPRYLVHEFLNTHYEPQYFSDVAQTFSGMGLDFAGSARVYRNDARNFVSSRFTSHLAKAGSRVDWETRSSFLRNESFRWDVFQRPGGDADACGAAQGLDALYIGALRERATNRTTANVGRRALDLGTGCLASVRNCAESGQFTISELKAHPDLIHYGQDAVDGAIVDLIAADLLQPLLAPLGRDRPRVDVTYKMASSVNLGLAQDILISDGKSYFSSPTNGSAVRLDFANGLLACLLHDKRLPDVPALFAEKLVEIGQMTGHRHVSQDNTQSQTWRETQFDGFVRKYLPRLLRLNILRAE